MKKYNIFNKKSVLFLGLTMNMFCAFAQYPTNGLKGYWSLNGHANDASGYNNNGSLQGGAVYCPDRFGTANSAVHFGGYFNSSALHIPNSPSLDVTNQLTIACWFKIDSLAGMNHRRDYVTNDFRFTFVTKDGDRGGFEMQYRFTYVGIQTTWFSITNNDSCSSLRDFTYSNDQLCTSTEWIHVAVVVDATSITMYANGVVKNREVYNTPITFEEANTRDMTFGRFGNNCNFYPNFYYPLNGRMDDIFYYNRALSPAEILQLMNYPAVYYSPTLVSDTTKSIVFLGETYNRNGFSLPAQNEIGIHTYTRTNGCDSMWVLTLDVHQRDSICAGDSISLGVSVTECDTNDYQWFVNGLPRVGEKDSIFSYAPANGDTVRCRVVPKCNDCFVLDTLYSGAFVFIQKPRPTLSVRDSSNKNDVCTETAVTFYALSTNGGTPAYQWIINGVDTLGETGSTFIYAPENNDFVQVRVTSSLDCATPNPVTSTGITMKINPKETPTIRIKRKRE